MVISAAARNSSNCLVQDCKWRLVSEQKWLILVDLGLADSKINLWVDWEALFNVEGSHYIFLVLCPLIMKMPITS